MPSTTGSNSSMCTVAHDLATEATILNRVQWREAGMAKHQEGADSLVRGCVRLWSNVVGGMLHGII